MSKLNKFELKVLNELNHTIYQDLPLIELVKKNYIDNGLTNEQISNVLYALVCEGKINLSENATSNQTQYDRIIIAHTQDLHEKGSARRDLGNKIKQLREQSGLTQQDLADKAGITRANVNRIEGGLYSTGQDILSKVAQALGKRLDIV